MKEFRKTPEGVNLSKLENYYHSTTFNAKAMINMEDFNNKANEKIHHTQLATINKRSHVTQVSMCHPRCKQINKMKCQTKYKTNIYLQLVAEITSQRERNLLKGTSRERKI